MICLLLYNCSCVLKLDAKILIIIILATMPYLKTIVNDNSKIGLWEINEPMNKINEIA